jgi:uncharacterized protein involved in exopolysaccharide biosynthesis
MNEPINLNYEKEISLSDIISLIRDNFTFFISFISLFALSSIVISLNMTNKYTSSAVLEVMEKSSEGQSQSFSGSSIAALTGISIGGSASAGDASYTIMAIIKSRTFANHLFKIGENLPSILAWKKYDPNSKKIIYDPLIYNSETKEWVIPQPSYLEGYRRLHQSLEISRSDESGFLYLNFEHPSPYYAQYLVDLIIKEVNSIRRSQDLKSTEESLTYLYNQLKNTRESELQLSINQIIESQLRKKMLANIKDDYAISAIDEPFVPLIKTSPTRSYIVIVSTITGFILSIMILLTLKYGFNRQYIFKK